MEKKKRTHWTTNYLKRIKSTEVTLKRRQSKRSKTLPNIHKEIEIMPIFTKEKEEKVLRTPDRVIHTPKRNLVYISPQHNITIPPTPHGASEEYISETRSRKRLFT
ncbi:hypothetical protein NEPAR06_0655 [Nematocida parisii]|uniref:Uncharacterized protein n=1 Tax=Nematocida parisii (strain ERTm3) TaxID=935791 RepID=I3EF01_NEMP3|nr:uncharacterized protein NEPG_01978 [Nematocida parisii ERTm1]EIJ87798.1 hypothetical protein NEQG_01870 [Nematocida parisii ERTm3]KAI5127240.1 hypothetical protein NEPAR08_0837 [Nematocida parisii]KAI5167114.1 hypothetical protein NEIRO02_1690 [Nematocida sp. AWRm79]KAI5186178.1 hypothetical protein NEIRO03_2230 [Nematocida sp. AWRm78]OAG33242.1 hypothetical protein NEIG_00992 [Nematocida sp. ERTm5]|eukprot:XP_013059805.1 hypothetical protein NEPG_01978 [Nematocida parisii ERTm1]